MVNHKPLPAIPNSPNLTTLSADAKSHRSQFIRHVLSETQDAFPDSRRESWACALEDALDELGDSIGRGEWLNGIRRSRKVRKARRDAEKHQADVKAKKLQETAAGKKVAPGKSSRDTSEQEHENSRPNPEDDELAKGHIQKDNKYSLALKQIREIVSQPTPAPTSTAKHLLLCVAPLGSRVAQDSGFDLIPANIGCVFTAGVFSLPEDNADTTNASNTLLYGLNEWDADQIPLLGEPVRLVGGTFAFKGVDSPVQHHALFKALRISIYMHLSLLLEQHFLANSSVQLHFPKPRVPTPSLPPPTPSLERRPSTPIAKSKNRNTFLSSGILSFFSKKGFAHRASTISPILGRRGSLDVAISNEDRRNEGGQRSSMDGAGGRLRRFSFISDGRPSFLKASQPKEEPESPFSSALKRIEQSKNLLSTSAGVSFAPPSLIVDLAEKEKAVPSRRLKGDEKAGLTSILGWDGKDARGEGMSGTLGFTRQQEFSFLFSQHVPSILPHPPVDKPASSSESSTSLLDPPKPRFSPCERPRWITYRYYSHDPTEDKSLGEAIADLASGSLLACDRHGCQFKRGQHELRFIHGGLRIVVNVDNAAEGATIDDDGEIEVWESCAICGATSKRTEISDGTYLFSFSKFLEVLVYSPAICTLTPSLCEHTNPPPRPWLAADTPLPRSRLNIIRHFSSHSCTVAFSLSVIEDIFELRVPRLQIARSAAGDKPARNSLTKEDPSIDINGDEEKRLLRREIKSWWEGVADHLDKLEETLNHDNLIAFGKALPRLPSVYDPYDEDETEVTPKAHTTGLPPLPPSTPNTPVSGGDNGYFQQSLVPSSDDSSAPLTPKSQKPTEPAHLLSRLRHTFQRTEQSLYTQLARTPNASLNDVRRAFLSAARGASRRLMAWQNKHLPPIVKDQLVEKLSVKEPGWWGKGCHPVPGGNIIVREDDWGSIIAFTMSTADYQRELAMMSTSRSASCAQSITPSSSPTSVNPPSFFSAATGYKLFATSALAQPDPDQEDVIWHEPEAYSAVISRKEHPRDPTSLLSLREVLRQKSPTDGSGALPTSRFGSLGSSAARATTGTPPSAWAKPDVQLSMQAADGEVSAPEESVESAGKILHEIETGSSESSCPSSALSGSYTSTSESGFADAHIRRGKASSIISVESDVTIGPGNGSTTQLASPPPLPPKDAIHSGGQKESVQSQSSSSSSRPNPSSIANTLTSGITTAMRFVLNNNEHASPSSAPSKNHHGLLSADTSHIGERPHIKYDWTIGKRLKFSCTVYYAKQFDMLRRRCGIDNVFLKSLSRSANWAAEGGKSKSNFWKTADDRFIIKTLVNAWNVADLQVLIELAPSYFRYMDATASKATVLAKLIGFYTIEIRNLETGTVQSKADLLVMENLFYEQKIVKTFDLKGIQGRKVKAGSNAASATRTQNSKTLFDGEWIEGQQQTLTLVRPHSKVVLREAIKCDAEFLSKSNIMDYSLLLGVDEERKQIACGLVDTIGSYTFAKTLEYKAKQGLNAGKDITVIPPAEYQERFVSALEGYFLACPDKWSKPVDDGKVINDPAFLPSVL